MPEITIENDPSVFTVDVKNKGRLCIDGYELQLRYEPVQDPSDMEGIRQNMAEAMRSGCSWTDNGTAFDSLNDHELAAAGVRVLDRMMQLGKEQGPSRTSFPPTDTDRDPQGASQNQK